MAKSQRGLPQGFDLNVEAPVVLGDYLDEEAATPAPVILKPERVGGREERVVDLPVRPQRVEAPPGARPTPPEALRAEAPAITAPPEPEPLPRPKPARREINMNAETYQMFDALLQLVRQYTGQVDAKGSELFEALVSIVYRAREELDLASVAHRGKWGSPTARAFPVSLANAFEHAVLSHHRKLQD